LFAGGGRRHLGVIGAVSIEIRPVLQGSGGAIQGGFQFGGVERRVGRGSGSGLRGGRRGQEQGCKEGLHRVHYKRSHALPVPARATATSSSAARRKRSPRHCVSVKVLRERRVSRPQPIGVILWHSEHYGHHARKSTAHERLGDRPDPGTAGSRDPGEDERSGSTRLYWHPAPRRSAGATAFGED